jgi:hypothetical protein
MKKLVGSTGWQTRFCHRNKISRRRKTNSKELSVSDRLPALTRFLRNLFEMLVQNRLDTAAQFDAVYGRFPIKCRGNFDQVPLSFCMDFDYTLEEEGVAAVPIKEPGSGALSKRQATLILFITPHSGKQPRAALIFRGTGQRISAEEKAKWDDRVDVYFQKNAWTDTPLAVQYANRTLKSYVTELGSDRFLLFCDNLRAHQSAEFKSACAQLGITLWFYPPGTTDITQPIDAGYGRAVKSAIAEQQMKWLESDDNVARWESNGMSASERRVLMTCWVLSCICYF